jgi:hypothetical protein
MTVRWPPLLDEHEASFDETWEAPDALGVRGAEAVNKHPAVRAWAILCLVILAAVAVAIGVMVAAAHAETFEECFNESSRVPCSDSSWTKITIKETTGTTNDWKEARPPNEWSLPCPPGTILVVRRSSATACLGE